MKEGFKFLPGNENVDLIFYFPLVLLLVKWGGIFEEGGSK